MDELPAQPFDERFSTNWLAAVQQALPASYAAGERFSFNQATNYLAKESRQGNVAAQTLWGFSLIVQSQSPEMRDDGLRLMLASANQGHVPAMLNLGFLHEDGRYLRQDYNEAFRWFNQAADRGVAEALLQVGGCYHYGLGTTQSFSLAAKYYQLAAAKTNFAAMKSLGILLMNGNGVEKNEARARYWLLRAANEGNNRRAMYNLYVLYARQVSDTNSMPEAFKWVKQSAALGDAVAANTLSLFYLRGWDATETNRANYHHWRAKAAALGATDAQYFMGQAYRTGDGAPIDLPTSLFWLNKAAAKNHPEALYEIGVHFLEERTNRPSLQAARECMLRAAKMGHREAQLWCSGMSASGDFELDCEGGKEWLDKAVASGWPKAEFLLSQLYYYGLPLGTNCRPLTIDKPKSIKLLRQAADHGWLPAQSKLAILLIQGKDMNQDKVEAERLLREAAGHGFSMAQNDLGFAIQDGDTAARDLVEAGMWCQLAASNSKEPNTSARATVNLAAVMRYLTPSQQEEVTNRAANFRPIPVPEIDPKATGWETNADYQQEDGRFGH